MTKVKMSDGLIIKFPDDMSIEQIKIEGQKYEDKIQERLNNEKELDDESIGIGESIVQFGENRVNSIVSAGANAYKKYRYGIESGYKGGEALINQAFANTAGLGLDYLGIDRKRARTKDFDPSKEDNKFAGLLMDFYDANKDYEEKRRKESEIAFEKTGGGITSSVIKGLAEAPAVVALYTPLTLLTRNPALGFGLTNALLESEKRDDETDKEYALRVGFAGVEGAISGKFLKELNQFKIPTRVVGMAAMGAAGPAENTEQRIANATTFGILGIFGPRIANESKLDMAVSSVANKAKAFMDQQKNLAIAERATRNVHKSLGAVIDQYNVYEKKITELTTLNLKLNKQKDRAKTEEKKKVLEENIINNETTIKKVNAEKGKLKTSMDNISAVLRDNHLFSTKFMRDFDMVSSLTPTEAKLVLVRGVEAVVSKKKKNKQTGKFDKVDQTVTQLRRNVKFMQKGKHESQFKNLLDAMGTGLIRKYAIPAKFLGDYPVAKYGVDLVSRYAMEANYLTKIFLENPSAFKTIGTTDKIKGFNPLKYTELKPTEGLGLTAWEKLPFKSQVKVVDMMAELDAQYTLYRKLPKEQKLKDTRFDSKSGEATASYLETFKLTPAELNARNDIQRTFDGLQKFYNSQVGLYGTNLSKINRRPNYFPRIYFGEYKLYVANTKGDLLGVYGASSLKEANAIRKKLLSEGELQLEPGVFIQPKDLVVNIRTKEQSQLKDISVDVFQDVMNLVVRNKSNKKAIDALDKAVYSLYSQRGFNVRKMQRKGKQVVGYLGTFGNPRKRVREFREAVTTYTSGAIKSGLRIKLGHDFASFYLTPIGKSKDGNYIQGPRGEKTIRDLYPEDFAFADMFKNNAIGLPINSFVKALRQTPEGATLEAGVSKWYGRTADVANTFFLLALNARFIMLQGIQPLQMLPHKLAGMTVDLKGGNTIDATTHAYHSTALGMMRTFKPTEFNIALAKSAVRQGVITEAMIKEFMGDSYFSQGKINSKLAGRRALNFINGKIPVGFMEKLTRLQATNIIGEHMLSLGYSKDFIIKQAPYIANQRMAEYHSYARPLLFNVAGAMSKPFGLFKTWAQNWYGQMFEAVQKAQFQKLTVGKNKFPIPVPKGQTTQLANFIASQAFFGGLKGVVGVTFVDAIIKGLNWSGATDNLSTLSDVLIKLGLPDVFIFGAPSVALNADMSNSLMAPTSDPTEIIALPSFEFAYEAFPAVIQLGKYYLIHKAGQQLTDEALLDYTPPAPSKIRDAWKKITPNSLHGWLETWYQAHDNPYYIDNKSYSVRREDEDWFRRKYLSMRSLEESKEKLFYYKMKKDAGKKSKTKSDIVQIAAELIIKFDGDLEQAMQGWLYDLAFSKGFDNAKDFHDAIKRRIDNIKSTPLEQLSKGGYTEEENELLIRAKELGIN